MESILGAISFLKGSASGDDVIFYLKMAGIGLVITLVTEAVIMLCFRLPLRKNFKPFLTVNLITQLIMDIVLIWVDITFGDKLGIGITVLVIAEALIILIEALTYRDRLSLKNGNVMTNRNTAYAITANIVSFLIEIPVLAVFTFIDFIAHKG